MQLKEIQEVYYISNGRIKETKTFNDGSITKDQAVYEVIRVIGGIPLFLKEHLDRLESSCKLLGTEYTVNRERIVNDINKLININNCKNKNLKIIVSHLNEMNPNVLLFFLESNYPSLDLYTYGVHTILFKAERDNPNAKVIRSSFRDIIQQSLIIHNAYEALLVNPSDEITEGSRSNIFLVKDHIIYTPPGKDVLKGVTRSRIIDLCDKLNIPVIEKVIDTNFLMEAEGIFMTGTSPKVLPITSVDDMIFSSNTHKIILNIIDRYNALISEYINSHSPLLK